MKMLSTVIYSSFLGLFGGMQIFLSCYYIPLLADVGMALPLPFLLVKMVLPWLIVAACLLTMGGIASFWYEIRWVTWCQKISTVTAVFIVGVLLTMLAAVGLTAPLFETASVVGK